MNKNNSLLDSIKAKMGAEKAPMVATAPILPAAADEIKGNQGSQKTQTIDEVLAEGGFVQLFKALEAAREGLELDRRIVYIDDESAEVLELLRKKAKIKSSLLVSCLLQEFFQKHKEHIHDLIEKRNNKLLD